MLEPFLLGAVLTVAQPVIAFPTYRPLARAAAAAAPVAGSPSFLIPVPQSAGGAESSGTSATFWLEVIDDDMPSFPIPVARPAPPEPDETPSR
jgi:hypothetical protein